jgi:predicted nuclease of predicted toxin-antitoxin system
MRFKVDENLPVEVAEILRRDGHDAATVRDETLSGHPDPHIAVACQQEGRTLITFDTDFADIRTYPPSEYPGLIVLRLTRQDKPHALQILSQLLPLFPMESLGGTLWIVEEHRVRIRT